MAGDSIFDGLPDWYFELQKNILWSLHDMFALIDSETADKLNLEPKILRTRLIKALLNDEKALEQARRVYKLKIMSQSEPERKFKLFKTFTLKVPDNYIHAKQLASLKKKDKRIVCPDTFMDKKFANTSEELVAGETYMVKMFKITRPEYIGDHTSMEDCFAHLCRQDAILAGIQGAALVLQLNKKNISSQNKDLFRICLSFGKNNVPWLEPEIVPESGKVPIIYEPSDIVGRPWALGCKSDFEFDLRHIFSYYLLCFCKK